MLHNINGLAMTMDRKAYREELSYHVFTAVNASAVVCVFPGVAGNLPSMYVAMGVLDSPIRLREDDGMFKQMLRITEADNEQREREESQ